MAATKGPSTRVNFNIGVVGEAGCGRETFIKSFTNGYNSNEQDFRLRIISRKDLFKGSLTKRHLDWLDGCGIPVSEEHKRKIAALSGLAPIIPIISKADTLTSEERTQQLQDVHKLMTEVTENSSYPTFFDFREPPEPLRVSRADPSPLSGDHEETKEAGRADDIPLNPTNTPTSVDEEGSDSGVLVDGNDSDLPEEAAQEDPVEVQAQDDTPAQPTSRSTTETSPLGFSFNHSLSHLHEHLSDIVPLVTRAALQARHWRPVAQSALQRPTPTAPQHDAAPSVRNIFAVVCTKSASGLREYPWGSVNTRDETVSDLPRLQRLVFECGNISRLRALTQELSIRLYHQRSRSESQRGEVGRQKQEQHRDWQMKVFAGVVFLCMAVMYAVNLGVLVRVLNNNKATAIPTATVPASPSACSHAYIGIYSDIGSDPLFGNNSFFSDFFQRDLACADRISELRNEAKSKFEIWNEVLHSKNGRQPSYSYQPRTDPVSVASAPEPPASAPDSTSSATTEPAQTEDKPGSVTCAPETYTACEQFLLKEQHGAASDTTETALTEAKAETRQQKLVNEIREWQLDRLRTQCVQCGVKWEYR